MLLIGHPWSCMPCVSCVCVSVCERAPLESWWDSPVNPRGAPPARMSDTLFSVMHDMLALYACKRMQKRLCRTYHALPGSPSMLGGAEDHCSACMVLCTCSQHGWDAGSDPKIARARMPADSPKSWANIRRPAVVLSITCKSLRSQLFGACVEARPLCFSSSKREKIQPKLLQFSSQVCGKNRF